MPQGLLPFFPAGTAHINSLVAFEKRDEKVTYFNHSMPIFSHALDDEESFRMFMSQLYVNGVVKQAQIVKAFGVSDTAVKRWVKLYRKYGPEGFYENRRTGSKPRVLTSEVLEKAQQLLYDGLPPKDVGKKLEVRYDTIRKAISTGKLKKKRFYPPVVASDDQRLTEPDPNFSEAQPNSKSIRSVEDSQAPLGMGATNTEGRIAASLRKSGPVKPHFEPAIDVLNAGVLMAVPALLATGLLKYLKKHFSMREGYYDIHTIFLLLAFTALSRIQSIEKLRYEAPGEWGKVLGLDRIPEVRCLREKIKEIAVDNKPQQWSSELCDDWLQGIPKDSAVLYVDGHVRVYHGKQTKLPRHYVSRSKLCLRANCDYWVNAMDGQPFFVINQAVDPGLIKTIEGEIIPRLIETVPNQPSQEELKNNSLLSRFTIIYDREGYSPDFMKRNWKKRIASTTYAKFVREDWPEDEFKSYEVKGENGEVSTQKLAERGVHLGKKIWVREIRKLRSDGRQTAIHSTEYLKDTTTLASGMFSRWSQENYFKYMMQNFGIDRLITYSLEDIPDTTEVTNPEYRDVDSEIRKTNSLLNRKVKEYGQVNYEEVIDLNESEGFILKKLMLIDEIEFFKKEVAELKEKRSTIQKKIELKDLPEEAKFKSLCTQSKHFIDTIKMVAYRAETAMAYTLKEKMPRKEDARSLLQGIYKNEADIIPDHVNKKLHVRLHNMANQCSMKAIEHLCGELNKTETLFPGTELQLVYEVVS